MIFGDGAAMGFAPEQIKKMSVWEFYAAREGWVKANSAEAENELSEAEADELFDWISA